MRRQAASAGLFVAGAATLWSPSASASGHALDALGFAFSVLLAVVAFVPWTISWWLLVGGKNSIRVFVWGILTSAVATVLIACGELPLEPLYVCAALLPAAAHLCRRVRAEMKRDQSGDGPGETNAG